MKKRTGVALRSGSLTELVAETLKLEPAEAERLVAQGAVYVQGKRARPGVTLRGGEALMAVLEEHGAAVPRVDAPPPQLEVVFEDARLIAVNKPAGVVAQPTPGRSGDSLLDLVSARLGHEAGLVHRLDKETSGLTVFGKTKDGTSELAQAFREGRAQKRYLAVTGEALPERGDIALPLSKDASRPGRWRASEKHQGIDAQTHFERLYAGQGFALVELTPKTGRTHQLRAHLRGIGFPIVGDKVYEGAPGPRCLLHAHVLEVLGLKLVAPLPPDLAAYFQKANVTPRT
jgi:23S rRNA pseudouridine1911/1915/1917 synthase